MLPRQLICASLFFDKAADRRQRDCEAAQGETDVRACRLVTTQCGMAYARTMSSFSTARLARVAQSGRRLRAPFTASRLPCTRSSSPIRGFTLRLARAGQQAAFARYDDRDDLVVGGKSLRGERDRMGAPSCRSALMLTSPRSSITGKVKLTGPLSKPITWQMQAAEVSGSIASSDRIRHSVTLTPKRF